MTTPDRRQPTPEIAEMAADVKHLVKQVDKLQIFMEDAPCRLNTDRLDRVERSLGYTVKTFIAAVSVGIIRILTGH